MSKKTLVSAITAALVVGAASTTFAAANPFSDVPADSWAYDAVSTLAADGVIDGYPDGTYKGQGTMTRYEMAQIVARAMAKTDVDKADKALVDKLAAEFAEELDNLGVRVADLEKKSDNVKWGGELRYRYYDAKTDKENGTTNKEKYNKIMFKLEPKAYVGNSGWTANARINYLLNASTSSNAEYDAADNDASVDLAYVEGPLAGATVTAGKLPVFFTQGLVLDDRLTGAQIAAGSDVFKTTVFGGRYTVDPDSVYTHSEKTYTKDQAKDFSTDLYGVQFDYTPNDKLALNAAYMQLNGIDNNYDNSGTAEDPVQSALTKDAFTGLDDNNLSIWSVGGSYAFNKNVALAGQYAESDADSFEKAGSVELDYKNADPADAGSWGAFVGYRHVGQNVAFATTYDEIGTNQKGFVAGAAYVPAENILATVKYFDGKTLSTDQDASKFFGQVEFFF